LKQDLYKPLTVAKQIFIIFMANNGYLDNVELRKIAELEEELYSYLDLEHKPLMEKITKDKITDEIKEQMINICKKIVEKY